MISITRRPIHQPLLLLLLLLSLYHQVLAIWCVQCDDKDENCLLHPPEPEPCPDDLNFCLTLRTYNPVDDDTRKLVSLVRTCGPTDMGWDCDVGQNEQGLPVKICHDTCSWHGCNHAHTHAPTHAIIMLLLLLQPLIDALWARL
ncbi:uncharacterized protein [Panulirus ornatus]|uniref:uncharacterized protein n=1 Tax=Panulirus ornatus TaxID=150431 RepID=UPI003A87BF8B